MYAPPEAGEHRRLGDGRVAIRCQPRVEVRDGSAGNRIRPMPGTNRPVDGGIAPIRVAVDSQEVRLLDEADLDLLGEGDPHEHQRRKDVGDNQRDPEGRHDCRRQDRVADVPEGAGRHECRPCFRVDVAAPRVAHRELGAHGPDDPEPRQRDAAAGNDGTVERGEDRQPDNVRHGRRNTRQHGENGDHLRPPLRGTDRVAGMDRDLAGPATGDVAPNSGRR